MTELDCTIKFALGKLFRKWVSDGVVSEFWTKALVGDYKQVEIKALIGAQEVTS